MALVIVLVSSKLLKNDKSEVKQMGKVNITINDIRLSVPANSSILEAAKLAKINIPTLCHMNLHDLKAVNKVASCI